MNNFYSNYGEGYGASVWIHTHWAAIFLLAIWSIFWKGCSLWHAGRRGQGWWFVVLLVINSVGILDIIYLFLVLKLKLADLFNKR
jgi:hypothetical protein